MHALGRIHLKPGGIKVTLAPWSCGKALGLGLAFGGALAASYLPCFSEDSQAVFVVLALIYFYFPGI